MLGHNFNYLWEDIIYSYILYRCIFCLRKGVLHYINKTAKWIKKSTDGGIFCYRLNLVWQETYIGTSIFFIYIFILIGIHFVTQSGYQTRFGYRFPIGNNAVLTVQYRKKQISLLDPFLSGTLWQYTAL